MIAKRIRELRIRKAVTQETMAKALKVSPQTISKWELNATMPDISMLVPIADYFGVSVDYLLREQPDKVNTISEEVLEIRVWKDRAYWRCEIKNISEQELTRVYLRAYFYDKDNNVIDYKNIIVHNLEREMTKPELLITSVWERVEKVEIITKAYDVDK